MFGAMTRAAERWRAISFTDFERRQIAAVRHDLDQEYRDQINAPDPLLSTAEPAPFFQQSSDLTDRGIGWCRAGSARGSGMTSRLLL